MRFRPIPTTISTALLAVAYGYLAYFLFSAPSVGLEAFSWSFVMLVPYTLGVITVYLAKEANRSSLLYAVLMPWLACLYVNETHRNQGLAEQLLAHSLAEAQRKGFDHLYLSTDLVDFYEKKGWQLYTTAYGIGGDAFKVYQHATT